MIWPRAQARTGIKIRRVEQPVKPEWGRERPRSCGRATGCVGAAALGCPVEQGSTMFLPTGTHSGALLRRTAESGRPHVACDDLKTHERERSRLHFYDWKLRAAATRLEIEGCE